MANTNSSIGVTVLPDVLGNLVSVTYGQSSGRFTARFADAPRDSSLASLRGKASRDFGRKIEADALEAVANLAAKAARLVGLHEVAIASLPSPSDRWFFAVRSA